MTRFLVPVLALLWVIAPASGQQLSISPPPPIAGVTDGSAAAPGQVGEWVVSVVGFASGVPLTTSTLATVTTISLTAGDWDVFGNIYFNASAGSTTVTYGAINNTAALPDASQYVQDSGNVGSHGWTVPARRFSLTTTTTIFLETFATFSSGTVAASGQLQARRRR